MTATTTATATSGDSRPPLTRLRAYLVASVLALLSACAAVPAPAPGRPAADVPAGVPHWWIVRVRMGYEDVSRVRWHLDALLADRVFGPILERQEPALILWRFHRRAAADEAGHQLRFLFYADAAIAEQVFAALRASALLERLRQHGVVDAVLIPAPGESSGDRVASQSDRKWPETVQQAWPHFAMGVSRNWLAMIRAEDGKRPDLTSSNLDDLLARYQDINSTVDALWRGNAQHAWLHHLNALFGYQPVFIREQRLMRF